MLIGGAILLKCIKKTSIHRLCSFFNTVYYNISSYAVILAWITLKCTQYHYTHWKMTRNGNLFHGRPNKRKNTPYILIVNIAAEKNENNPFDSELVCLLSICCFKIMFCNCLSWVLEDFKDLKVYPHPWTMFGTFF